MSRVRCACCGQELQTIAYRGLFSAQARPPRVFYGNQPVKLRPTPSRVLMALASQDSVTRDHLLTLVKSPGAIKTQISHIRRALPDDIKIVPIWGDGYRLVIP